MNTKIIIIVIVVVVAAAAFLGFLFSSSGAISESPTESGSNAKINIDEVCQGALAYMSFPDGASAEAFVKDCKEGKHPEVIEKYKADNNLGDGTAI